MERHVLLATDAFPPVCGGSGWSTYELARELRAAGDRVTVLKIGAGGRSAEQERVFDGLRVLDLTRYAPTVPGLRNYFKNERLYPRVADRIQRIVAAEGIDLVHGQHVLSAPGAVTAARRAGIPSVVTVRDYWPVCFRSDLQHRPAEVPLCPGCARVAGDHLPSRIGLLPFGRHLVRRYLASNMALKRESLIQADAVIAVSSVMARDLRHRAPELANTRIEVIPNPVNIGQLRRFAATPRPIADPYALYVGKLAPNKGTDHLVGVMEGAALDWPLVIAGDGPDRAALEAAAARTTHAIRFLGWIDQEQTGAWLAHASMLIFPSRGPESLSRVLIEASALGVPIAAMTTGGTTDIIEHDVTGLLSDTAVGLADNVRRLRHDEALRRRLGEAAARQAAERFDSRAVAARIRALYHELLEGRR